MKKGPHFSDVVGGMLASAIELNDFAKVKEIVNKYTLHTLTKEPDFDINSPLVKLFGHDMNALGYSLFLGHTDMFVLILDVGRAKMSIMHQMYKIVGKRPIEIICESGHKNLLEQYIPFYVARMDDYEYAEPLESESISLSKSINVKISNERNKLAVPVVKLTPIQRAVDKERFGVIQYLFEYFSGKESPVDFDIHYRDEHTGDNCALISCRTGNLEIMKYLHEVCKADFNIYNKRKENAIQIMAVWTKKRKEVKFLNCFKYLIETIGVDFTYSFEETILILDDKEIIEYLEEVLRTSGISIDKDRLDKQYSITKNRVPGTMDPELASKLNNIKGPKFNFKELFQEELYDPREELSSIYNPDSVQSVSQISFINITNS